MRERGGHVVSELLRKKHGADYRQSIFRRNEWFALTTKEANVSLSLSLFLSIIYRVTQIPYYSYYFISK